MEIWILIGAILAFGFIGYRGCVASEMSRWMHQRHMRELKLAMMQLEHPEFFSRTHDVSADEIRKALDIYKISGVTTTLPTGEVEAITFGEEVADEVIKEAHNKTVD